MAFDPFVLPLFGQLIQLNQECAHKLFSVWLSILEFTFDLVPEFNFKGSGKCRLNRVLLGQVQLYKRCFVNVKGHHVELVHQLIGRLQRQEFSLIHLAQESELQVQAGV